RVVARGHLDLHPALAQQPDQRPEHQHVRRRREVDPNAHYTETPCNTVLLGVVGVRSTWCSCQRVNASKPQSWRLTSSRRETWSSISCCTAAGRKNPCRFNRSAESVSRANGSSSPRSHAAAGIEKPRFLPCTISRGSRGSAALRSKTFFCNPRTFCRVGNASARFVTAVSR